MSTIRPQDALPHEIFEGSAGGERWTMRRAFPEGEHCWDASTVRPGRPGVYGRWFRDDDVSSLVRLIPARTDRSGVDWKAMYEQASRERDEAERERDSWRERAESAEVQASQPEDTPTRAEVEETLQAATNSPSGWTLHGLTDAVWSLVSGPDPAVHVVRESDLPDVERNEDGWTDGTRHGWEGTSETAMECVETHLEWARFYTAAARAIEAGQVTDPVEDKARELARAGGIDFDEQEPAGVEMLIGMARHVLGQEAGDE